MIKALTISTKDPALYHFLKADLPNGVKIMSPPPIERRGFDLNVAVNFDIKFTIDLGRITVDAFLIWFLYRVRTPNKKIQIALGSRELPNNETEAKELLIEKMEQIER
jgi:hypothetical protein